MERKCTAQFVSKLIVIGHLLWLLQCRDMTAMVYGLTISSQPKSVGDTPLSFRRFVQGKQIGIAIYSMGFEPRLALQAASYSPSGWSLSLYNDPSTRNATLFFIRKRTGVLPNAHVRNRDLA
jgi:hypothetical protein